MGKARDSFEQALAIAVSLSSPLEEGRAREGIGRHQLRHGQADDAAASLRTVLAIYERINNPGADRIRLLLHEHGR